MDRRTFFSAIASLAALPFVPKLAKRESTVIVDIMPETARIFSVQDAPCSWRCYDATYTTYDGELFEETLDWSMPQRMVKP
jgi:hypothetical protein